MISDDGALWLDGGIEWHNNLLWWRIMIGWRNRLTINFLRWCILIGRRNSVHRGWGDHPSFHAAFNPSLYRQDNNFLWWRILIGWRNSVHRGERYSRGGGIILVATWHSILLCSLQAREQIFVMAHSYWMDEHCSVHRRGRYSKGGGNHPGCHVAFHPTFCTQENNFMWLCILIGQRNWCRILAAKCHSILLFAGNM